MTPAPATTAPADGARWAVKCGKCAVEQHANGRCPDACPICGAVHPAWPKPTTPAPADGAPGERVSAHPFVRCPRCGQCDTGQTGEYPCPGCGLPTVWDDDEILGSEDERKAVADALNYAANDYSLVPSGDVRQTIIRAAALLRATAAPLPAPSASADVGADVIAFWRTVADDLERAIVGHDCADRAVAALRAACDALSTAASAVTAAKQAAWIAGIDEGVARGRADMAREVDEALDRLHDGDSITFVAIDRAVIGRPSPRWSAECLPNRGTYSVADTPTAAVLAAAATLVPFADAPADAQAVEA